MAGTRATRRVPSGEGRLFRESNAKLPMTRVRKDSPYERIKTAIGEGKLLPGEPLVEKALAEWCGVSRTPIREALTRLEQDGLVARTDRGLVVRERSEEEILDIYELRIVLEGTAARGAAARRTAIDLIHLRRAAAAFREAKNEAAVDAATWQFHRAMWTASHNETLYDVLDRLQYHVARYPHARLAKTSGRDQGADEHDAIVAAIEDQDLKLAEELARAHLKRARELRLEILAAELGAQTSQRAQVRRLRR